MLTVLWERNTRLLFGLLVLSSWICVISCKMGMVIIVLVRLCWLQGAYPFMTSLRKIDFCWKHTRCSNNPQIARSVQPFGSGEPKLLSPFSVSSQTRRFSFLWRPALSQSLLQPVFLVHGPVLFASSESVFVPVPDFPEQDSGLAHHFQP